MEHTPRLGDRALFPDLDARVYLNHAAQSPLPLPVRAACRAALDDRARRGVDGFAEWIDQRHRLRGKLGQLIGANGRDIALLGNTSAGVLAIALSVRWQPGDRVLLFAGDFPTNVTPWQRAAELFGLEVVFADFERIRSDRDAELARIERELAKGVRMCAISFVRFQTGWVAPLAELSAACRRHGTELFVDAIQGVGAVPLGVEVAGIDYLAAGGHKWLMAPEGTGFLWIAPDRLPGLRPAIASWLGHEDATDFLSEGRGHLRHDRPLRRRADVFETGVTNTIGFAGMEAAVDLLLGLGVERIHDHVQSVLDPLERALTERGFRSARSPVPVERSCILAVEPPAGVDGRVLRAGLDARGVRCAYPDGWLRFSPHWPNDAGQVDTVAKAIDDSLRDAEC